jgi:hypothetical protein
VVLVNSRDVCGFLQSMRYSWFSSIHEIFMVFMSPRDTRGCRECVRIALTLGPSASPHVPASMSRARPQCLPGLLAT